MRAGGEMLRGLMVAIIVVLVVAVPALGQETLGFLQPLIDFLSTEAGIDLEAEIREPGAGAMVTDPANDFEHITGERPRFTPNYIDIREAALFEIDPGPAQVFGPTGTSALWAPTGPREIQPRGHPSFFTYTTTLPKDGTQYQAGALLFRIGLREQPPPQPEGVCDYTVWVYDAAGETTFQNLAEFPLDPATGSNLAFGVRITPQGGGVPAAFALALDEEGGFQPADTDVRALVIGAQVGLLVPRPAIEDLAAVNYHAVCSAQGSAIEPASSGADQTGLAPTVLADAGAVLIMETPVTATPTLAATTTTVRPATTATTTEAAAEAGPGVALWVPAIAATALLGALGYWVFTRSRNLEERALAAWKRAERALAAAETEAEPLVIACLEARSVLEELEHERVDLCRVWPPACLEEDESGGAGLSTHDQHFRRMALGELWVDYKEGRIGAEEVEARWRQVNNPEFQDRMRDSNQAYRETLEQLDSEIAGARAAMETVCTPATPAATRVETARQAVFAARRAYVETLESPPPSPQPGTTLLIADCVEGTAPRLAPDGPTEHLRVNLGFMITIGRFAGKERNLERGERLVLEMEGIIHALALTPMMNRIRQGGVHTGWTGHEYEPGVYWVSPDGIRQGETGDDAPPAQAPPEQPTPVVAADSELTGLPGTIGDHATSRVAGWMTGFDTFTMQRTFFHQLVTTRPYRLWECRDGRWAREDRVWRFEVGEPLRNRGEVRWFSGGSPGRRAQFETEVNRLAWVATGMVTRDLRRLLRWRGRHTPETRTRS